MTTALGASAIVPPGVRADRVSADGATVIIEAKAGAASSRCPDRGAPSASVRSYYQRRLADLPPSGRVVRNSLTARRFRCSTPTCRRSIFTERVGEDVLAVRARRTARLEGLVHHPALAPGGRPAAGLARRLMIPVSKDTLLRVVRRKGRPTPQAPNVTGVDDRAWKRDQRYGAIICDLERRRPVALLPDREPATAREWLAGQSQIVIVARDRGRRDHRADHAGDGAQSWSGAKDPARSALGYFPHTGGFSRAASGLSRRAMDCRLSQWRRVVAAPSGSRLTWVSSRRLRMGEPASARRRDGRGGTAPNAIGADHRTADDDRSGHPVEGGNPDDRRHREQCSRSCRCARRCREIPNDDPQEGRRRARWLDRPCKGRASGLFREPRRQGPRRCRGGDHEQVAERPDREPDHPAETDQAPDARTRETRPAGEEAHRSGPDDEMRQNCVRAKIARLGIHWKQSRPRATIRSSGRPLWPPDQPGPPANMAITPTRSAPPGDTIQSPASSFGSSAGSVHSLFYAADPTHSYAKMPVLRAIGSVAHDQTPFFRRGEYGHRVEICA